VVADFLQLVLMFSYSGMDALIARCLIRDIVVERLDKLP